MDDTSLMEAQTWLRRPLGLQPDALLGESLRKLVLVTTGVGKGGGLMQCIKASRISKSI
jgi:hypothetical protein